MITFDLINAEREMQCIATQNRGAKAKKKTNLAQSLNSIASKTKDNLPYQLLHSGVSSAGADYAYSSDAVPKSGAVKKLIYPTKFMSNSFLAWDLGFTLKAGIQAGAYWETVISTDDAQEYAEQFVDRFMNKEGGEWHDDGGLSNAIQDSTEGQQLTADIKKAFKDKMFLHKGDFTKFTLENSGIRRPSFSWSSSPTLKILVGGTQELTVTLSGMFYDVKNCNWSAHISVEIRDDFGVTESDITDASPSAMLGVGGLMDMWVLQKQRGQKPFTSVFNFSFWCTGDY